MNCINRLIGLGFNFSIKDGCISYEYKGKGAPPVTTIKPSIEDLKLHKPEAAKYIENIVTYEIYDDNAFDEKMQGYLDIKDIRWLRFDCYTISRKLVLIGIYIENPLTGAVVQ